MNSEKKFKDTLEGLCIIIPTHNRAKLVEKYLQTVAKQLFEKKVHIVVYDTSDDDSTEQIVRSFNSMGFSNIEYKRYEGPVDRNAIDLKVYSACSFYCSRFKYLWLTSDRTIININVLSERLCKSFSRGFDLIIFDNQDPQGIAPKEYSDCRSLFHDLCWRMTSLSSVIVSSEFLSLCIKKHPVLSPNTFPFWLPMSYFHTIAEVPFKAVYFTQANSWSANFSDGAFWALSGNSLWQWGKTWCDSVDSLPVVYNMEKDYVIKSHDKFMRIFSLKSILNMKASGNITYSKVREFSKYLPRITETKPIWFFFIAIFANRQLIILLRKIYHSSLIQRMNSKLKVRR